MSKFVTKVKKHPVRSGIIAFLIVAVITVAITLGVVLGPSNESTTSAAPPATTQPSSTSTGKPAEAFFVTNHVTLRDGINLTVDYYAAPGSEPRPVILELTPYGRTKTTGVNFRYEAPHWHSEGYVMVVGDCRGTGDSEGNFVYFAGEGNDTYDVIEWIAQQPWSNGRVGMRGSSYTGTNQWYAAREQPPHLSCITPCATVGRPMEDIPYHNGAFAIQWATSWLGNAVDVQWPNVTGVPHKDPAEWLQHRPLRTADVYVTGRELATYREFMDHPTLDDYWKMTAFTDEHYAKVKVPSLAFTGWFDGTMWGTIWRFQEARRLSPKKTDQFLVVGPYVHYNAPDGGYNFITGEPMTTVGDMNYTVNAVLPGFNMTTEFFKWCLQDGPRPNWSLARTYVTGSNRWLTGDDFPVTTETSMFLHGYRNEPSSNRIGRLEMVVPQVSHENYNYDPRTPLFMENRTKPIGSEPVDVGDLFDRDDVLLFTSEPTGSSHTVVGQVTVELNISSSAKDTDFFAILMDVGLDGRAIKLGSKAAGQIRVRYRNGYDREVLMEPGASYVIRIDMHEIGHTFLTGHRIRLAVTSSFFPWVSANPNTGNPIATDTQEPIVATQTVHYGGSSPSRLILPVVQNPNWAPDPDNTPLYDPPQAAS